MAEYIEREADGFKYYVVRNKATGLYFRGKGENKWSKYYNQAAVYRFKKHAENAVVVLAHRGEQTEVVEIRIVEGRRGRWLPQRLLGEDIVDCSECKTLGSPHWNWCPLCGADMRGEKK